MEESLRQKSGSNKTNHELLSTEQNHSFSKLNMGHTVRSTSGSNQMFYISCLTNI